MNTCLRCGGFLFSEYDQEVRVVFNRCIMCGDVTDEVILRNRALCRPPASWVAEVLLADLRGAKA